MVDLVASNDCAPILVRLAWHDSGTFDNSRADMAWPEAGGAIGSITTDYEINAGANAGLQKAFTKYLAPIKKACPAVSWADLIQLASATAIEQTGGPAVDMKYGRVDGVPKSPTEPNFGLPDALPDFGGPLKDPKSAEEHLKYVFYKYGMDDKDIVALSGAHTLGRAFKNRSGTVEEGYDGGTAYTTGGCPFLGKSETAGGRSWTKSWLKFDNSYFTEMGKDPECVAFPTDLEVKNNPCFKPYFDEFAADQAAFFAAYAVSHKKLSELGSKFEPAEGIKLKPKTLIAQLRTAKKMVRVCPTHDVISAMSVAIQYHVCVRNLVPSGNREQ